LKLRAGIIANNVIKRGSPRYHLVMTELALRDATYEDLLKVPDHLVAELIDGELFTSPRPATRHARAASNLLTQISMRFDDGEGGPGGWWIVVEPELHLGRQVLVPDVAGWRRENMPVYPDSTAFDVVPDWVCEVQSPSTARLDRMKKLPVYAEHRVQHVWIVDPIAKLIEVYRLESGRWVVAGHYGGDDVVRIEPFEAVELVLSKLWIEPVVK
jgi:Uma2 family endonuclease